MPIKTLTLTTHFIAIEADHQIPKTGPIRESMASWIERFVGAAVEETKRRFFFFQKKKTKRKNIKKN